MAQNFHQRCAQASKTTSSGFLLALYNKDKTPELLQLILANPACPVALLEKYYRHSKAGYRAAVAKNPNSPDYILEILSKDIAYGVRKSVAINVGTPEEVLEALVVDKDDRVQNNLVQNPNAPYEVVKDANLLDYDFVDYSRFFKNDEKRVYQDLRKNFDGSLAELMLVIKTLIK